MNFKQWLTKRYGKNFNQSINYDTCSYLTRKGWLGCRKQVLELFKHPKLNMDNSDLKFLKEEIENL